MQDSRSQSAILARQIAYLWNYFPEHPKRADLQARMECHRESDYFGGLGELLAFYVLKNRMTGEVEYSPSIAGKNPDFLLKKSGNRDILFEVFSICSDAAQREWRTSLSQFQFEMRKVFAPYVLTILGSPIRNQQGSFAGAAEALSQFFSVGIEIDSERCHELSFGRGGAVCFKLTPRSHTGPVFGGSFKLGPPGPRGLSLLLKNLKKKVEKYRFEFVGICHVSEGDIDGPELFRRMDRDFWGDSTRLEIHGRLTGLLLLQSRFEPVSGRLSLSVQFLENPASKGKLAGLWTEMSEKLADASVRMDIPELG